MTGGASAMAALESLGSWAFRAGWQAGVLACAVAVVLLLFGRRLSPGWRFGLWALVLVRLAVPAVVEVGWVAQRGSVTGPAVTTVAPGDESPGLEAGGDKLQGAIERAVNERPAAAPVMVSRPLVVATPQKSSVDWRQIGRALVVVWLAGVALIGGRVFWSTIRLARAVGRMKLIDDGRVVRALADGARELGLRRAPVARELPGRGAPVLVGFVRPVVLLPRDVVEAMADDELRLIVLHELAHVKRRDVLVNWLATAVCVLHWPNLVAWLVAWRMRVERELACDEIVLSAGRAGQAAGNAYARTIVKLVEALSAGAASRPPVRAVGAIGILEGKTQIHRRLVMIARYDTRICSRRWPALAGTFALLIGGAALCGGAKPKGSDPNAPGAPPAVGVTGPGGRTVGGGGRPGPVPPGGPGFGFGGEGAAVPAPEPLSDEERAANAATEKKLRNPIKGINFNGTGLSDVLDFFRDVTGIDVVVPWPVLESNGVNKDAPVNFRLNDAKPAGDVLTLMFRSMGDVVTYQVEKGAVVIGPGRGGAMATVTPEQPLVTRVYDVSDLLGPPAANTAVAPGAPGTPEAPGGFTGRGEMAPPTSTQQLIELITRTVEPNSWREAGGSLGSITPFKTKLVVKTTETAHREIVDLLKMLHDKPEGTKAPH